MLRDEVEQVKVIASEVCRNVVNEAIEKFRSELMEELAKRQTPVVKEKPAIQK